MEIMIEFPFSEKLATICNQAVDEYNARLEERRKKSTEENQKKLSAEVDRLTEGLSDKLIKHAKNRLQRYVVQQRITYNGEQSFPMKPTGEVLSNPSELTGVSRVLYERLVEMGLKVEFVYRETKDYCEPGKAARTWYEMGIIW